MAGKVGTLSIDTLLAARFTSAARYGLDNIAKILKADLQVHNTLMQEMLSDFCDVTGDRQRIYGSSDSTIMYAVDEFGRAPTQKPAVGTTVGFPLKLFQYAIGWTRKWLENHTPADMAIAQQAAQKAHRRKVRGEIQRAIFLSGNYSWPDYLVDNITLGVKRLVNADGSPIPEGPNGEVYNAAMHTHYLALAGGALTTVIADAVIKTVVEHGWGGQMRVYISSADESAWRGLTGFQPYLDPRLTVGTYANFALGKRLDITRLDNRAIGIYGAAEVWVKPWMIPFYFFAFDATTDAKPAVLRTRSGNMNEDGLAIAAELDMYPLHAQYMETEFGVGIWNRTNGAVGYYNGATYVDPVIPG
ncbi:MAG TPA: hypothetical protein VH439_17410 [Gemmatimonadales bacterium]|jgi:hypothetical protein